MINIEDAKLEEALADLGASQPVQVTKTRLAIAILGHAVDLCKARGPQAWHHPVALGPGQGPPGASGGKDRGVTNVSPKENRK